MCIYFLPAISRLANNGIDCYKIICGNSGFVDIACMDSEAVYYVALNYTPVEVAELRGKSAV